MIKKTQFNLFFTALLCAAFTPALNAQDVDKEMTAFAQQYQDAYNREDHATLKTFYTDDAVRVAEDGTSISGAEAIRAFSEAQFKGADVALVLQQQSVGWSDFNHAYIAKGTYHVKGLSAKGDNIDISGKYSNIMLQVNGAWKIAKSMLGN